MLTGPLILDGIMIGYASRTLAVEAFWVDESVYEETEAGTVLLEPRYFLEGRFGFEAADATDLAQLKALTSRPFPIVLRSRRAGDPAFPEVEVLVRRTSPIEETGPLYRRVEGHSVYRVLIEFRAMQHVEQPIGAIEGGYTVVETGETEELGEWEVDVLDLGVWGEAALAETTFSVPDGEGGALELSYVSLHPKVLSQLLTRVHPDDEHCLQIDTTGTGRIGTSPLDIETFRYNTQETIKESTKGSTTSPEAL